MVPREGGHTQIPRASKGPAWAGLDLPARRRPGREPMSRAGFQGACLGLGILRPGGLDLPARRRPGREPMSRAFQGPGIKPSDWGALFKKISKSWYEVFSVWNYRSQERGKVLAPARVVPQKVFSPIGQVRELPFCRRGAWGFGGWRRDLSVASEPAWQVRWLVRVGRPRARLGDPPPRRGPPRRARLRTT